MEYVALLDPLAQSADPGSLLALIREYGAIAVLAGFCYFLLRGRLISVDTITKMEAAYEERLSEQQAQYEARLIELRKDRDEWKSFALEGVHLAGTSVRVADEIATKAIPSA